MDILDQPITSIDRIPKVINGITLNEGQRTELQVGKPIFLENMQLKDGRIVDGKVNLVQVGNELKLKLIEKKPTLTIPESILGHKLTQEEKEALQHGKTVPIKLSRTQLYVQLDSQLNRIVIKTDRELAIPKEIGGHTLTEKDKIAYINNITLPTRLYYNHKSQSYFLANITRTTDGRGVEFTNYKPIDKEQAPHLKERFNIGDPLEQKKEASLTTNVTQQLKTYSQERFESFEMHVKTRNFSAIKQMTDNGFTVSKEHVKNLISKHQYSPQESKQLESTVKIKSPSKDKGQAL